MRARVEGWWFRPVVSGDSRQEGRGPRCTLGLVSQFTALVTALVIDLMIKRLLGL